jgi:S1-C subfamily serine protease
MSTIPTTSPATVHTDLLDAFEGAARTVADAVAPSVVSIGRAGRGSGLVVAAGRVLTNAHNLRDRTTLVTFADGRAVQGSVSAVDPHGDLAVLEVDTADVPPVEWSEQTPETGSVVFAVARGRRGGRTSFGMVSGTGRTFRGPGGRPIPGSVEHTAPLARGSSGGALVDRHGKVVGLNTHRIGDGFYLALVADDELRRRVEELAAGRTPLRLTLGVAVAPAHVARRLRASVGLPARDGLLIRTVEGGSPADRAGIVAGDLLVRAGDRDLATADDLFAVLDGHDPDQSLEVGVVRGAEDLVVAVSFGADAPTEEGSA